MTVARHIPQRTCVACRRTTGQRELIRLVRTAEGKVEIDVGGRRTGRGAYLCPTWLCLETALKDGRLEYALRVSLSRADRQLLLSCGEGIFTGGER